MKQIYLNSILWISFIKSINFNKKPILIFNNASWHLQIEYKFRKKTYIKFLSKQGYNVISVDFESNFMIYILNIILNGFNFDLKKKSLLKNIFTSKFISSFKYSNWDLYIKENYYFIKGISPNRKEYKKIFLENSSKPLNQKYWNKIYNIFNTEKVKGMVLTQQSYEELPLARFALDNNLKVIYFESETGIEVINPSNHSIMDLSKKAFNNSIKKLSKKDLKEHDSIINKRTKGENLKEERVFTIDLDIKKEPVKEYFSFNSKAKRTLCLYLHCFTDSPNHRRDTDDYSPFVDFFELALYIVEYCAKNKIPMIIKSHPESSSYPSDEYYLKSLYDITLKFKKTHNLIVEWVGDDFKNFYLTKLSNPILVTGRGTVVSECGYLGIPSISFVSNPWQDLKNVSFLVKSENEFEKMFHLIDKLYQPELAKKEGIILSAMFDRGFKNLPFKLGRTSKTIKSDRKIELSWEKREIL